MLALPQSNLNAFLFADVGVEANGMALSVLSVLARFDLDPWQEASRLADLSRTKSIEALAGLIAMSASRWSLAEAVPIAARLVTLLPRHAGAAAAAGSDLLRKPRPLRPAASGGWLARARTSLMLTNAHWFGIMVLLAVLFTGLALEVVLRPSGVESDGSLPAQAADPDMPMSLDGFQGMHPSHARP